MNENEERRQRAGEGLRQVLDQMASDFEDIRSGRVIFFGHGRLSTHRPKINPTETEERIVIINDDEIDQ